MGPGEAHTIDKGPDGTVLISRVFQNERSPTGICQANRWKIQASRIMGTLDQTFQPRRSKLRGRVLSYKIFTLGSPKHTEDLITFRPAGSGPSFPEFLEVAETLQMRRLEPGYEYLQDILALTMPLALANHYVPLLDFENRELNFLHRHGHTVPRFTGILFHLAET